MFTTLTNWLRPASGIARRRSNRIGASIETLEDRVVLNSTYFPLGTANVLGRFAQDWTSPGLITTNGNWSGVESIEGFSGAGLAPAPGTSPATIVTTGGSLIVTANQSAPDTLTPGGIVEFDGITDRTVALAGDSTNQAPYLLIYLDTRGTGDIQVSYTVRDIDSSSRNSVSQVALQYRVSPNGNFGGINFINVPAAFVTDATTGGTTRTTAVSVTLPTAVNEQEFVQLRIITSDAAFGGSQTPDEWIGIDDILVDGNVPPIIAINSTILDYTENDPLTPIDPIMGLTDADSPDFNTGVLTVDYPLGSASADDRLIINNQVVAVGAISLVGLNVRFTTASGTSTIGTVNAGGGIANTPLRVTFNSTAATQQAVQALLRNIGYRNLSDDPLAGIRNIQFQVSDGDGQISAIVSRRVNVIAVNDPPVVLLPGGPVGVIEGDPARLIDVTATVTDPDSPDFDTGTLTVSFLASGVTPGDILAIQKQGTGVGLVGIIPATSEVTYSGVVIGTYSGGVGAPLVITFNAASAPTPQSIQAVTRAITFQNISDNPPGDPRPLRFILTDGDGGTSQIVQVAVTITQINDVPVLTPSVAGITYTENSAATQVDPAIAVADPDSPTFNNGTLAVSYNSGGTAEDRLTIRNGGLVSVVAPNVRYDFGSGPFVVGQITLNGVGTTNLQVTFNTNATLAAVQAVLQNVTYANVSDNPSTTTRVVQYILGDGVGFSTPITYTIGITALNDGPTIAGVPASLGYQAGFPAAVLAPVATVSDPDTASLNSGNLTINITANGQAGDVLGIRNQGTGIGRIGVSGSTVTYSGVTIGTFSGGTAGSPLVITFSGASATPAAVSALAASITFRTPNGAGVAGIRTVTFNALDFAGGATSNVASIAVNVTSTAGPNDDFYEINEDFVLSVPGSSSLPLLIANDPAGTNAVDTTPVAFPSKGSLILQANGGFQYTPNLNANGNDTFTYRWRNTTTSATGTAVVTVIVNAVNDAPIATSLFATTVTVNEDSGAFGKANFATFGPGGGTDEAGQVVTRTITNNNNLLFTSQPTIDANGQLTFTPAPNANGTAIVSILLKDDGGTFNNTLDVDSNTVTVSVVVNAINDTPTFQLIGTPPSVGEDSGPQVVTGFASNFKGGPSNALDEVTQLPTYILTPTGTTAGLTFSAGPSINAAGDLIYTASANGTGTASFQVQVQDDGGTALGGSNLSSSKNLTITVGPVDDPPTVLPDSATVIWNTQPNFINVLANDSGAPDAGDTVSVSGVTQGGHGTVAIQPGGVGVTYQPAPGFVGTDTFQYTGSDGQNNTTTTTVTINVIRIDTQAVDIVALGSGPGGNSQVRLLNASTGQFVAGFAAFDPSFQGGVSVATGDVNGDGVTDVIVGASAGGGPRIMIIDGNRLGLLKGVNQIADPSAFLQNFFVYDYSFTGGVTVASGDVNGDGKADIIVGTGPGGGPNVKVISGAKINNIGPDGLPDSTALLASFFAFDEKFRGGVNVGTGDVNGDGYSDVIAAAAAGGGSHVKSFNGLKLIQSGAFAPGVILASFYAFGASFLGGVNVAAGDLNGDGLADYIVGAGQGGGSHVKVISPLNLATPIASFYAFGSTFGGGVDIGFRARSGGATPLLTTGTGAGTTARFVAFAAPRFTAIENIDAFDVGFTGGVEVG